ncbi:hypothetical protein BV898_13374 [Hypsibius exemplaris]|uniref:G-protein coupled receptors family 1 profile domain-containing protein n=1 Tax=Hypsibius exemplaris TaxID=2072580 RepID=A0A1W0WAU6_HYPEX|nr:hypothetical protein BV898_13374 [Hypsibius exemplaris]
MMNATGPTELSVICWFSFTISVCVMGSCLLVLMLVSSLCNTRLYRGSKVLIMHLLVIQLCLCGVTFPLLNLNSLATLTAHYGGFRMQCSLFYLANVATIHAENWAALLLAVNRFVALALPHLYSDFVSRKSLCLMIFTPWLIGISNSIPIYFGHGVDISRTPSGTCNIRTNGDLYGAVIWPAVGAYTPIALMGIIYFALFLRLVLARCICIKDHMHTAGSCECERMKRKRMRQVDLAKILVVSYVWHCMCFLPAPILLTLFPQLYAQFVMLPEWTIGTLMPCGYAASPVIFLSLSSDYRIGLRYLMRRLDKSRALCSTAGMTDGGDEIRCRKNTLPLSSLHHTGDKL